MLPVTGILSTSEATLFLARGAKATIEWLQLVNDASQTATVQLWLTVRNVKVRLTQPIALDAGAMLNVMESKPVLRMDKDAVISGAASVAGVHYLVTGQE